MGSYHFVLLHAGARVEGDRVGGVVGGLGGGGDGADGEGEGVVNCKEEGRQVGRHRLIDGYFRPQGRGGPGGGGRQVIKDAYPQEVDVGRAVDDCPHIGVFLVDQPR